MPTAAKLVGGLALALTAAVAAWIYAAADINPVPIGWPFIGITAAVSFICGWFSLGRNSGNGIFDAAWSGLRSLILLIVVCALTWSGHFILTNLDRTKADDVMDLPLLWLQIGYEYAASAFIWDIVVALLVGGVISGIVTNLAARRWT
ncbi:MAG: TrgA family protein [Pseudomonadota bacterium]